MAGIANGQTFIQYDPPVGTFQVGDVWIKTSKPDMVWNILKSKTWQEMKGDIWGNFGTTETPITHVWDGTSWLVTSDFSFVTEMRTSIEQTAEKIESVASRTEVIGGELRETKSVVAQTADSIKSMVTQEDIDGIKSSIIEQTVDHIKLQVTDSQQAEIDNLSASINVVNGTLNDLSDTVDTNKQTSAQDIADAKKALTDTMNLIGQSSEKPVAYVKTTGITIQPGSIDIDSTGKINMNANSQINLKANSKIDLATNSQISLTSGGTVSGSGVVVSDKKIDIVSGGSVNIGGSASVNLLAGSSLGNSAVTLSDAGIGIQSGGTISVKSDANIDIESGASFSIKAGSKFTVDSANFEVDKNGKIYASNAQIGGHVTVDGNDVWHRGQLMVSTERPDNPVEGMIWIKPDTSSIPAAGTWSHAELSSRPWSNNYVVELNGTSIGAAPSGATYTYEVSVPVYYAYDKTGTCTCTVYLGATSGAKTISMGTQSFTASNEGGNIYKATMTSAQWLGNSSKIYMLISFSNGSLMTVNSYSPFSCTLMAKSTTGASGWKACEVQMYIG